MGASSQIRQLLADLPIDETWVLVGMTILALAALSHLYTMWRNARHGMGGKSKSSRTHHASLYFDAWTKAADNAGLHTGSTDEALDAPHLQGRLRGLPVGLEMKLQRSGRRKPDPEAINPATVHCRIDARAELPFPWRRVTIRQFILPESVQKGDVDDVVFGFDLPEGARVQSVRLDRRARVAMAKMADRFRELTIVDGRLTAVDEIQPSRNTARWADRFGKWIRTFGTDARTLSNGGVTIDIVWPPRDMEITLRLECDAMLRPGHCRVHIETDGAARPDKDALRDRLQDIGATAEKLYEVDDGLRLQVVVDGSRQDIVRRLVESMDV